MNTTDGSTGQNENGGGVVVQSPPPPPQPQSNGMTNNIMPYMMVLGVYIAFGIISFRNMKIGAIAGVVTCILCMVSTGLLLRKGNEASQRAKGSIDGLQHVSSAFTLPFILSGVLVIVGNLVPQKS